MHSILLFLNLFNDPSKFITIRSRRVNPEQKTTEQEEGNQEESSSGKRKSRLKFIYSIKRLGGQVKYTTPSVCGSCGQTGHKTDRSQACRDHEFNLVELLKINILNSHHLYIVYTTLFFRCI